MAVEFALVVPLLVILLLGVTTAGVSFSNALGTTDAVREGSRYGATVTTTPPPARFASWSAAVQQKVVDLSAGALKDSTQVCVSLDTGGGSVLQQSACAFPGDKPANPSGVAPSDCLVKVWAKIPVTVNIVVAAWSFDVVRASVARYERACA